MKFRDFLKHWNKTSGVLMIIDDENIPYFIEIKILFLFKVLKYLNVDLPNYTLIYLDNWVLINRIVEYKNSEDPVVKEILTNLLNNMYVKKSLENI